MNKYNLFHQIWSFILPVLGVLVVPFLLIIRFKPFRLEHILDLPYLQIPIGLILFGLGLSLLVITNVLFIRIGKGTLAPWDPTQKLVTAGVYSYLRNPMITGVAVMILGESILAGSFFILAWFVFFIVVNTIYIILSEEPALKKRFGSDYQIYRANVPMWIPRTKPWHPNNEDSRTYRH